MRPPTRSGPTSCAVSADAFAMEPLLYLVHRIPFPPNKGDKVRSFHLLRFLAGRFQVHLGTFVDNPADLVHVARLSEYCASSKVVEIRPALARIRSVPGLWTGEPLTLRYYRDASLAHWVNDVVRERRISKAVVFSSAMAQYVSGLTDLRVVVDFVDVDSAKWSQYGKSRRWPLSTVFEREGERLLAFERAVSRGASASVFVTPAEADLFRSLHRNAQHASTAHRTASIPLFSRRRPQSHLPSARTRNRSFLRAQWTTGPTSTPCAGS